MVAWAPASADTGGGRGGGGSASTTASPGAAATVITIGGIPSLADLRRAAGAQRGSSGAGAGPGADVTIVNLCAWWGGYAEACDDLGITHMRCARGEVDSVEVVSRLKRLVQRDAAQPLAALAAVAARRLAAPHPPPL